ncbi:MAG: hypothetical protein AAGI91_11545 [Bacteroidota bacterium]
MRALLLLFLAVTATAQPARYTAFVEVLGNTGIASLNFDSVSERGYGFRVGGFVVPDPLFGCRDTDLSCRHEEEERALAAAFIVVMGHRLVGTRHHKLELGLGVLVGTAEPGVLSALPRAALTATLGYRIQPETRGPGLRVGLAPIIAPDRVLLRPGVSLSYGLPTPR